MDNKVLEQMIKEAMASVLNQDSVKTEGTVGTNVSSGEKLSIDDYPLIDKRPDLVDTPTGININEITLEKVVEGSITSDDLKIRKETLFMQAEIADNANRPAFANNLRRAAELISVGDSRILEIYNALRPNRSSKEELLEIAQELEGLNCPINAKLVRNAAEVYEQRRILRRD